MNTDIVLQQLEVVIEEIESDYLGSIPNSYTRSAKKTSLRVFREYVSSELNVESPRLKDWSSDIFAKFEKDLSLRYSSNTHHQRISNLPRFAKWCCRKYPDFENPTLAVLPSPQPNIRPEILKDFEIKTIRLHCESLARSYGAVPGNCGREGLLPYFSERFKVFQDWFLFELILHTGLRPEDIVSLNMNQVDELKTQIHDVLSTGYRYRRIPLVRSIQSLFELYLTMREELLEAQCEYRCLPVEYKLNFPLFISLYAANLDDPATYRISKKTLYRRIEKMGREAGCPSINARKLRETFGYTMYHSTNDSIKTADAMRFRSSRTRYMRIRRRYG